MAERKKKTLPFVDPQPVVKQSVCSVCGLDWEKHGDDPDVNDCIRLLKAAATAAKKPQVYGNQFGWNYQGTPIQAKGI